MPSLPFFPLPKADRHLEEVAACDNRDWPAAFAFALARLAEGRDERPLLIASSDNGLRELGRPFVQGSPVTRRQVILVRTSDESQALWALEEALKSGAVSGAAAIAARPSFTMTRRLAFAAAEGQACAILLRPSPPVDLSAARLRWQIAARPSKPPALDVKSPGPARLWADLVRRRDGPPASWMLEIENETYRLRLASELAGDGLVAERQKRAA